MKVKQNLATLFYLQRKKKNSEGLIPIYIRITIDGQDSEISLGEKILAEDWHPQKKCSRKKDDEAKRINESIADARSEIRQHFDILRIHQSYVTADMVKQAYLKKPVQGEMRETDLENQTFSNEVDLLIQDYLKLVKKEKKESQWIKRSGHEERLLLLQKEKGEIKKRVKEQRQKANTIFDNTQRDKSLFNAVDEFLLNFLERVVAGQCAYSTLAKWVCTKLKVKEVVRYRYKAADLPLAALELKFATHMKDHLITARGLQNNSAMKHIKNTKQIVERAVSNGWILINPVHKFKCPYIDTDAEVLTMHDVVKIIKYDFGKILRLDRVRDFFIFCCFTGFAFTDAINLTHEDIFMGDDGKQWVTTKRIKTKNAETVPLLPIAKVLIEKYANDPRTEDDNRLFPKISLDCFNGYLKEIAAVCGVRIELISHKARYFFANVVTHNNGVSIKTTGKMLGQKSIRTTEIYVKANLENISNSMKIVEKKLFTNTGKLKALQEHKQPVDKKEKSAAVAPVYKGLTIVHKAELTRI